MTTNRWRTIGVLGGMGPLASADFLTRLVLASHGERDNDSPHILLDSNPHVPDRNAALAGDASPGPVLADMAKGLVAQGASVLAMPCNAAHGWAADIAAVPGATFVNMVDAAVARTLALSPHAVGVLGVKATITARLYHTPLEAAGVHVIDPDGTALAACVASVKAARYFESTRIAIAAVAASMIAAGADVLIVACSELPMILSHAAVPLVDATATLVDATLAAARIAEAPSPRP
jgi:aspartate racemase